MKRSQAVLVVFLGILALVVLGVWALPRLRSPMFHGQIVSAGEPVADFTLTAHTGEPVRLSDWRGRWVALYFGYTFCPDVCPTTLAQLAQARRRLGAEAARVQVLMVTVDPERDTPERLAAYVRAFDPSFVGLTGTPAAIAAVAGPLGVYFARQEVEGAAGYLVDHTASVLLLDPQGRLRLIWPPNTSPELMAEDLSYLLRRE
jgi:protein SCO1/2